MACPNRTSTKLGSVDILLNMCNVHGGLHADVMAANDICHCIECPVAAQPRLSRGQTSSPQTRTEAPPEQVTFSRMCTGLQGHAETRASTVSAINLRLI